MLMEDINKQRHKPISKELNIKINRTKTLNSMYNCNLKFKTSRQMCKKLITKVIFI